MSQFTPQMETALSAPIVSIFGAIEILLPSYTLRLLDGAGVLSFGGRTFVGLDPTFGSIDSIEEISDGGGDDAPAVTLTLNPSSDAAAGVLAAPDMQGSQVSMWIGAFDAATGGVVPDPLLVFLGSVEVPTIKSASDGRQIEFEIVSAFEQFFFDDEGARLSDTFHQSLFPGETGLAGVTGVDKQIYWGVESPRPSVTYYGGGGGGAFLEGLNYAFR
jgi:hypothetical protein